MSDHHAVSVDFNIRVDDSFDGDSSVDARSSKININFSNPIINDFYNSTLYKLLENSSDQLLYPYNDPQTHLDNFYSYISSLIKIAEKETLSFQLSLRNLNSDHETVKGSNKKKWFSPELKTLKSQIMALKCDPNFSTSSTLQAEVNSLRKKFRKVQRLNIFLLETSNLKKFEYLAKHKDKNKFWKFIKSKRKLRSNEKKCNIPPDKLHDHYSKFFHESYDNMKSHHTNISQEVKKRYHEYIQPKTLPFFKLSQLEDILKNLKASNVRGHDHITYSLLKNIKCFKFKLILLDFFNQFLSYGTVPSLLNVSIIKPIVKNADNNSGDLNNIRPLSISNCLAQIFEKLILINSPSLNFTHKNQFGFKKNTSCNHAIFTLKETVLYYTLRKSACRIASLDAEKAFDKIWRDGLFIN